LSGAVSLISTGGFAAAQCGKALPFRVVIHKSLRGYASNGGPAAIITAVCYGKAALTGFAAKVFFFVREAD